MTKEFKIKWIHFIIARVVVLYIYMYLVYMTHILIEITFITILMAIILTIFHLIESLMLLISNREYMRQLTMRDKDVL